MYASTPHNYSVNPPVTDRHCGAVICVLSHDVPSTSAWCRLGESCKHVCFQLSAKRRHKRASLEQLVPHCALLAPFLVVQAQCSLLGENLPCVPEFERCSGVQDGAVHNISRQLLS